MKQLGYLRQVGTAETAVLGFTLQINIINYNQITTLIETNHIRVFDGEEAVVKTVCCMCFKLISTTTHTRRAEESHVIVKKKKNQC